MNDEILNAILLPLAHQFEHALDEPHRLVTFDTPGGLERHQAFKETMPLLWAEGSVHSPFFGLYQLTPAGYAKYMERIHELKHPKEAVKP